MTRADKKREKRLAQIRRAAKKHREKVRAAKEAAKKAKRSGYTWRVRPQEPPEHQEPPAAPEPTPAATLPWSGAAPAAPEPEDPVWTRRVAKDKVRQNAAVAKALAEDADHLKRLLAAEDEVLDKTENRFIRSGDGTPETVIESDCRICGSKKSGNFKSNYCCSACLDTMTFPYHDGSFDDREPNIRARIAKLARRRATKLTVPCGVEGCEGKVPDPEGFQRTDETCDECMGVLYGDRAVLRGVLRMRF